MSKETQLQTYEKLAKTLRRSRSKRPFLGPLRRELLSHAQGAVLEVAVGPGINFQFYPPGLRVTAVDFSPSLLAMARVAPRSPGLEVTFLEADVEQLAFEAHSFDTVVSTHSLCAYEDPVRVLRQLSRFCRPGGQILLLEHGLSTGRWYSPALNGLLRALDGWNLKHVGCHTGRDMLKIIQASGIGVRRVEASFGGVHYLIVARPQPVSPGERAAERTAPGPLQEPNTD